MSEPVRLVIWDLDETFWRGTLTEGGITWREEAAEIVRELARRGIVSAICSKNDLMSVRAILMEHGLWDSFVFPSIDWTPKGPRVRRLIETIQLRAPSVLFIDDNSHNLEEARASAPGLQVASETAIPTLLEDPRLAGKDDHELRRLKQYKVLETRKAEAGRFHETSGDVDLAFLRASGIRVRIENDVEAHLDRAIELINRTNQLNFTKWRLPEDGDKARALLRQQISDFATQAGLVQVTDKYGDYGFCGYFQIITYREVIRLRQFCFSCRVLGMGVEAFIYQRLGRPLLKIKGAVLSDPLSQPPVDWIAMDLSERFEGGQSGEGEPPLGSMAARGGCVLWPLTHYFRLSSPNVIGEFNTVRDGKLIRLDHSLCLRHALLGVTPEQAAAIAPLGYLPEDFHSRYFEHEGEKPIWVFSNWADAGVRVYQHRRSGITVPYQRPKAAEEPAVGAELEAYIAAEFTPFRYEEAEYKQTLDLIFSRVPAHGLMFVFLSETPNSRRQERNRWCVEAAAGRANIRLLRLADFVDDKAEILNANVTHFDRKVYHRLYLHMLEEARASLAADRAAPPDTASGA